MAPLTCSLSGRTFFDTPDLHRREETQGWCDKVGHDPPFTFGADPLPVGSSALRNNCSRYPRNRGSSALSIKLKGMKMFSGFLRICERRSSATRSVREATCFAILTRTADGATGGNSRPSIKLDSECLPLYPGQQNNLSLQKKCQNTSRFCIFGGARLTHFPLIAESTILNDLCRTQKAEYRHGNRQPCLKGTRITILDEIERWTRDFNKPPVYWLNGLAGMGKSTIAQTIAERTFAEGRLGASFFCSRDFEDRRNLQFIFPTIASQLARRYSDFRSILVPLVQSDSGIVHESLAGQMNNLVVKPLMKSAISTVIVIDALDECQDNEPASAILTVLGQFVEKIPKVKFFVTGRPEPQIRNGIHLLMSNEATEVFVLHEVESSHVHNDIRLFYKHNFSQIRIRSRRHGLDDWPTRKQLDLLCERAAGLFIYATATVRFVDQTNKNPKRQLDQLIQSQESKLEGKTKLGVEKTLDSLYMSIFQGAFGDDGPEDHAKLRSVLGAVILAKNPLSPSTIAALLGLDPEDVFPILSSLNSLLTLSEEMDRPIRPFHKSFSDFTIDPTRCTDPRFCISPPNQHAELVVGCFELMNQKLGWRLLSEIVNAKVEDRSPLTEQHIDEFLEYACGSWHEHFNYTKSTQRLKIMPVLRRFLEEKHFFSLAVNIVFGGAGVAHILESMENNPRVCYVVVLFPKVYRAGSRFFFRSPSLVDLWTHLGLPLKL